MTGRNKTGATWHHTTVVLRSDIYRQALERGIDISDACNRALALLTGSEYHRQQLEEVPVPPPVIIAGNGAAPQASMGRAEGPSGKMHPVINADDPAAPVKVVQAKSRPAKKGLAEPPAEIPAPEPAARKERPSEAPGAAAKKAPAPKGRGALPKKRPGGDALKTFFSARITRTDDTGDHIGKDELYELFTRFCREHRVTPVPERRAVTVALKNRFALTEKSVNGTPSWTGIRLK